MIESTTGLFASACGTTACDKNVAGYAIPNHVHGLQHLSSGSRRPSRSPQIERNNPRMAVVMDRSVSDCRISDRSVGDCQAVLPKAIPQARWLLKRPAGDRFDRPSTLNKLQLSFTSATERLANVGSISLVGSQANRRTIPTAAQRGKVLGNQLPGIVGRFAV
jgi:hypothetical protein